MNEREKLIRELLLSIGEDPNRNNLVETPRRVSEMLDYILEGYKTDVKKLLEESVFEEKVTQMIIVKDINFFSLCEHHMMPFFGKVHIGYTPNGKIIGIGKVAKLVNAFSRRLQVQERLTDQIAKSLKYALKPFGVGVVIEARHLCMEMRGVEKQKSLITTSAMFGEFHSEIQARNEFLHLIGLSKV